MEQSTTTDETQRLPEDLLAAVLHRLLRPHDLVLVAW
jgi:hypothetical protein